jgi:hypothetical protein
MKTTIIASLIAALVLSGPMSTAQADVVKPLQARSLELGDYSAVVYFHLTVAGWEVVTTLAPRSGSVDDGMRYVSLLTPGESQTLLIGGPDTYAVRLTRAPNGLTIDVVGPPSLAMR